MLTRIEIGRIAGIPIYLDMMFVLILLLFTYPYFTSGDSQAVSAGIVIIVGLILSVLLHELGHAFAARLFGTGVSHIDLTGIGGIAHFDRSLPRSIFARSTIYLAGPLANLCLWQGLGAAAGQAGHSGTAMLAYALATLAGANFYLMAFNLLPAFPLDGGRTLEAWLSGLLRPGKAERIVAGLGLAIAALLAITALPANFWRLILAFFLFQMNWEAWQASGRWTGRR